MIRVLLFRKPYLLSFLKCEFIIQIPWQKSDDKKRTSKKIVFLEVMSG